MGLDPKSRKHVGKYSMGMRQRLGLAQAIMEDPELLILDEPMNGLDNQGVEDIRRLLLGLKEKGKTILLASHNREDIAVLCGHGGGDGPGKDPGDPEAGALRLRSKSPRTLRCAGFLLYLVDK